MRSFLFSLLLSLVSVSAAADVNITRKIHYASNDFQTLDVYQPSQCFHQSCPVVMWVHGGGWRNGDTSGNKSTEMQSIWAEQGIVMVGVNYRLSPTYKHPAHVQDVAAAIAWVRKNINNYGGDSDKISLLGHSAGAHLIALVATNPIYLELYNLSPDDLVNVFPIDTASFDLTKTSRIVGRMVHSAFGENQAVLREASPNLNVIEGRSYPAFIIAAAKVRRDAVSSSQILQNKLKASGASADLMIVDYPGLGQLKAHGMIAKDLANIDNAITKTLIQRVLQ
jgi:arylformamidase